MKVCQKDHNLLKDWINKELLQKNKKNNLVNKFNKIAQELKKVNHLSNKVILNLTLVKNTKNFPKREKRKL